MKPIASISTTQYILDHYHLQALKKYGQNFLIDVNVVEKIVACGNVDQDTAVIEVGPGIGALTQILSQYAGHVYSYEIDERFKPVYHDFIDQEKVDIIFEDFLSSSLDEIEKIKEKYSRVILIANLPYYITTQIIEKIVYSQVAIDQMIVMVQKEVAKKYCGDYKSPLTMMIHYRGMIEYMFTVSQNVFIPRPHVDSAIMKISLNRHYQPQLKEVLDISFKQRRKTIYNNLKQKYSQAQAILEDCGINEKTRSEQLEIEDFIKITDYIKEHKI